MFIDTKYFEGSFSFIYFIFLINLYIIAQIFGFFYNVFGFVIFLFIVYLVLLFVGLGVPSMINGSWMVSFRGMHSTYSDELVVDPCHCQFFYVKNNI
jgi:hypothetical protein